MHCSTPPHGLRRIHGRRGFLRVVLCFFVLPVFIMSITACGSSYAETPLTVSSVSPASGSTGGANVTVYGTGFASGMQVWFGSSEGTVLSVSSTSAQVAAPAHSAGSVQLTAFSSGSEYQTPGYVFNYVAPAATTAAKLAISGVSPATGSTSGTSTVTVTGTGFASGMQIWFGSEEATIVSVTSTSATVVAPAEGAGTVQLTAFASGSEVQSGYIFTYVVPAAATATLSSVSPSSGPADQAASVTLTGSNFQAGSQVRVGGTDASVVTVSSASTIKATLPAMAAGQYTVEVVSPSNAVASLNNAFTYLASLAIVTGSLPGATVGKVYSADLAATGGVAPYTWSIAAGALPTGLSMTSGGVISGAATKAGDYSVTIKATDSKSDVAEETYSLDVAASAATDSPAPTGTALTSCQAINNSGSYYLANNVTCTTQGFAINANNVTLNLNGYTITYGTSSAVVPAISICDNWYTRLPASSCGSSGEHESPTITNGKIVQAAGAAPFTPAIWIGQGNNVTGGTISGLTITVQSVGTQPIYGDFPGSGWTIENNTINDNVTNIQASGQTPLQAREQFQGVAIYLYNGLTSTAGDTIADNTINGSPQGGILDTNQNSKITDNVITLSSYYSNDYGVTVLVNGQVVSGNQISGRGRGIDAESSNFVLTGNVINVHEEANNSEYGGCELAGSDGIRIKQYVTSATDPSTINAEGDSVPALTGWTISNNTATVNGTDCEANGLDFTNMTEGVSGTVSGNSFTTTGPQMNVALYFNGADQPQITYSNNTFTAAQYCSVIGDEGDMWPSADTTVQSGQHWSCGTTVWDTDLSQSVSGTPPEALTLQDAIPTPSIVCGPYSAALVKVGGTTKQCGE